jgi:peptidyl-prolyl cis-trans isomerase SurA
VTPLIPQLQREARNEQEFNQKLEALQDNAIQNLIDRVLIIKDFQKDDKKHVPESFVDNQIAEQLTDQFDNDRSKFLAYLRARGTTMRDYRKEVEEDIIYNYMMHQQHKSQSIVSPVRIEQYYKENKDKFYQDDSVHLRLIQLSRAPASTDGDLKGKAEAILLRLRSGEKFEDLAKEYSSDSRRAKGGDWGWMKRSDLKPEFSEPLFAVKKGECSEPVILPEGCFLLYAEDRKVRGNPAPRRGPRPDRADPGPADEPRERGPLARAPAPQRLREALHPPARDRPRLRRAPGPAESHQGDRAKGAQTDNDTT